MTNDPIEATGELLAALGRRSRRHPRRSASATSTAGSFLFHVGVGFDAAVVAQVERRSAIKRYLGHAFFAYAAVDTWARHYDRRHPHFAVELHRRDGTTVTVEDGYFAICLKTNPYTFLGDRPFDVAPGTGLDTPAERGGAALGRAPSTCSASSPRPCAAAAAFGRHRKVTVVADVVRADRPSLRARPYQVDGDYLGDTDHLEFRWEPDHLRLVPSRPGAHRLTCEIRLRFWVPKLLHLAVVALYAVATLR